MRAPRPLQTTERQLDKEMLRLGDVVTRAGRVTATALDGLLTTVARFVSSHELTGVHALIETPNSSASPGCR